MSYMTDLINELEQLKTQAEEQASEGNFAKALELTSAAQAKAQEISDNLGEMADDLSELVDEIEEAMDDAELEDDELEDDL